jgi:hypothetical protein
MRPIRITQRSYKDTMKAKKSSKMSYKRATKMSPAFTPKWSLLKLTSRMISMNGRKNVPHIYDWHRLAGPFPLYEFQRHQNYYVERDTEMRYRERENEMLTIARIQVGQRHHEPWSNVSKEPFPCWLL